jgi:hypothetical protein
MLDDNRAFILYQLDINQNCSKFHRKTYICTRYYDLQRLLPLRNANANTPRK